MHLVDRDRLAAGVDGAPVLAVRGVAPRVVELGGDDRGGGRPELGGAGEGIGLQRQANAVRAEDLELVGEAGSDPGDEDLPDPGVAAEPHDVAPAVPGVEVADDADAAGVRGPDREMHAVGALVMDRVRAHPFEEPQVGALAHVVVVHRAEHRTEGVGVGAPPLAAGVARPVLERLAAADRQRPLEEAGVVAPGEAAGRFVGQGVGLELGGSVDEGARQEPAGHLVHAEHRERIGVAPGDDRLHRRLVERRPGRRLPAGGGFALDRSLAHRRPLHDASLGEGYRLIPQMSCAYCRMVRSEENHPMRAVLRIAFFHQTVGSDQSASTSRWAAA